MSACRKALPRLGCWIRGSHSWRCPGLKETHLTGGTLESGGKWVSHPANFGDFSSPPPHHPFLLRSGWSLGFAHRLNFCPQKIKFLFFFSSKAINHICKTEQPFRAEKETSSQAAFPALSVTLSHRQLQFHSAIVFIRKTNFSAQLRLTSYVCSSIKSSSNVCTEFCAGLCSSVSSSVCCHWTASF